VECFDDVVARLAGRRYAMVGMGNWRHRKAWSAFFTPSAISRYVIGGAVQSANDAFDLR